MKKKFKLSTRFIVFVVSSVAVAVAAVAVAVQVLYQSSGTSHFILMQDEEGMRKVVRTFQDYEIFQDFSEVNGSQIYLISSTKKLTQNLDAEGVSGSISWTVRTGAQLEKELWTRTEASATELNLHGARPVLVSGLGGCCGAMTGYRLFNLKTGRLLMSFNDFFYSDRVVQPISVEVPNSNLGVRYLGGVGQDSTRDRDFINPTPGKQATLLIKYASDALKQKLQVDMPVASGYGPSVLEFKLESDPAVPGSELVNIRDNQAELWNIDGSSDASQIGGVLLKVTLDAGFGSKTLYIPVRQDRLDLGSASIPAGITVRSIPL